MHCYSTLNRLDENQQGIVHATHTLSKNMRSLGGGAEPIFENFDSSISNTNIFPSIASFYKPFMVDMYYCSCSFPF